MFDLSYYQYELPEELIAQHPSEKRDQSRIMVIDRSSGNIHEMVFAELIHFLNQGDTLVLNDTKVFPARLLGKRESGGKVEIFLLQCNEDGSWVAMARPARKLKRGSQVHFSSSFSCQILDIFEEGKVLVRFNQKDVLSHLDNLGMIPLPHYIKRSSEEQFDKQRYQTVYAKSPGAVAAPTAGLHFSEELLGKLNEKGITQTHVTLHVGLGTFKPVMTTDIRDHPMHSEFYSISEEAAETLNKRNENKRQICVGTTCCRTLETAANEKGVIIPGKGMTDIFIYPGYQFKYVQNLLTNFHLPKSTLLMLVCAFAGYELTMEAYKKAVKDRFRFYSYGDAMLIL